MFRARTSFGLSVSTQLTVLVGTLAILLLTLAGVSLRFAGSVERAAPHASKLATSAGLSRESTNVRQGTGNSHFAATPPASRQHLKLQATSLWVLSVVVSLFAIFFLLPLAVAVVRRFSVRLEDMTDKMLRISRNETDIHVPFVHDRDELGDMARAVHIFKANAESLLESQELIEHLNVRFDAALNNMSRGLSMFDADQNLVVCNKQFRKMYGLPKQSCQPGMSLRDLVTMRVSVENIAKEERAKIIEERYQSHLKIMKERTRIDATFPLIDGRTVAITYEPMSDGGCVALHEDITKKRQRDEKINKLALHDSLTGLANRFHFREQLDRCFRKKSPCDAFAVHLIDLDRFKDVNDTLGHAAGDVLLRLAAARINKTMRKGDFVARLGGDEFAVIQAQVTTSANAMVASHRLIKILSAPFQIQGQSVMIGASVGVVMVPSDISSPDDALKKADIALYSAKDQGRGGAVLFKSELETQLRTRHQLGVDLRYAIKDGQFELHYQPIVSLDGSKVACCEALMRWRHPLRGWIPPDEFIPVAEELGLISLLGEWALHKACAQARNWPDGIKVAVNLSPSQFEAGGLVEVVQSALESVDLAPERLELEVTESLLLRDVPQTVETLHKLRALGVNIALDDFGTGYASLSYLISFPFNKIKIDRMFVRDMINQKQSAVIVCAIIKLARSLGIRCVAEGVETAAQLHEITRLGCDEVQGYLFSKPVPASKIGAVLSQSMTNNVVAA